MVAIRNPSTAGQRYLEVYFRLGSTLLKKFFVKVGKNKEESLLFSSAAHILMARVYTELRTL